MVDLFKWCLSYSYFIGRLTGLLNFEIDFKTGRAQVTKRASISAVCSNLVIFIMLTVYVLNVHEIVKTWELPNCLQEYVLIVLSVFRITCIFLTLASRWWNREEFMQVCDAFRRQYSPEILPHCRKRILNKIFCATTVDTVHIVITTLMMRKQLTLNMALGTWGLFSTTVIVHVIVMQYFVAMASIRGRYILLNKELQALISETRSLNPNRIGVFITSCCSLADRFEKIAKSQSDLQAFIDRLTRVYEVQVASMIIAYYIHLVANLYFVLSLIKHNFKSMISPEFAMLIYTTLIVLYFVDFSMNASNIVDLLDTHDEMVQLLGQRTLFQPGLDQRLEAVVSQKN